MSFPRHREIFPSDGGASLAANAPAHRLDESPAGYSLAGCSPAEPASASPTGHQYAVVSSCRSRDFHRTVNCVLTVCVSRGGKRIPIHLSFHSPRIALRHAGFAHQHSQRDFAMVHILPNRSFANLAIRQLLPNPLPDAMGRVPLLARRPAVGFQHPIHELDRRFQLPARPFGFLPWFRHRVSNRLAHHAPVHAQLLGHSSNRAYAELILSTDLFEQLHLGSPVQRVSSASGFARIRVPVRFAGGPKQTAELNQNRIPKSA